jgi:hypothetical protein
VTISGLQADRRSLRDRSSPLWFPATAGTPDTARHASFLVEEGHLLKRIGDRQFLYAWQLIRAATQPDPEAMRWRIGDVQCHRHRYSHMAPELGVTLDVCHLERTGAGVGWRVMVAAENWWDDRRTIIRANLWASLLAGSRERALDWFQNHPAAAR